MDKSNVVNHKFKNYKKTPQARKRRRIRIVAVIGAFLILSSLLGSLIYYL